MNKVYRVVFSQLTGSWVVTSELAKGHTKSNSSTVSTVSTSSNNPNNSGSFSSAKSLKKLMVLTASAGLMLSANSAFAACTGAATNVLSCSGTDANSISMQFQYGPASITVNNWVHNGGHLYISPMANSGDATLTGTNVTATGTSTVNGLIHLATNGAGNASLSMGNSTITSVADPSHQSSGLVTHATQTGNASTAITGNMKIQVDGDGVLAVAGGANSQAKINISGSNNVINASGVGRHGANASASNGHAIITSAGGAKITTSGESSNALSATGKRVTIDAGVGEVYVISGDKANGIYGKGKEQGVNINSEASISTGGYDAAGIRGDQDQATTSGDITITTGVNSSIETNGIQAEGIHAYMGSESIGGIASSGNVTVNAKGNITTHGASLAEGIYGAITHSGATGNVDVTFSGDTILTTGTAGGSGNRGILASQLGSGDVTVNHMGSLIQTAGNNAHGIEVRTGVAGTDGGVSASAGKVEVGVTGKIVTAGSTAHGVFVDVRKDAESIKVTNSGNINVSGDDASAIKVVSQGSGDVLVTHEAGAVITSTGSNSTSTANKRTDGIHVFKGTASTGDIKIVVDGDINTAGSNRASGVLAQHQGEGNVTVFGSGNITAAATNNSTGSSIYSYGLAAASDGTTSKGNARVEYETGTITTGGVDSYALYAAAVGVGGNATVINTGGTLNTSGAGSHGIWARNATTTEAGNALVGNYNGSITTSGEGAHGIFAESKAGLASIENTGSISTSGDSAYALKESSTGSAKLSIENTLTNSQKLTTSGEYAHTISARVSNGGTASDGIEIVQTGGALETTGYDAHGIQAITNATSGDVNVTMTDTVIDLKGRNSDGIHVQRVSTGDVNKVSNVNFNITTNGGEIKNLDGVVAPTGSANYGIVARQYEAAAGDINITNNGTKISTGVGLDGKATTSAAIDAQFMDTTATGNINIFNNGELSTKGAATSSSAIYVVNLGSGKVDVTNLAKVSTEGVNAAAIHTESRGSGNIKLINEGEITTKDGRGLAAWGQNGDVLVQATNNITTAQATATTHNHGIDAGVLGAGNVTVNYFDGTIKVSGSNAGGGNAIGIAAWDRGSALAGVNANINLGPNAIVDASEGVTGLQIRSSGSGNIFISDSSEVHGGVGAGIEFKATGTSVSTHKLDNFGLIDSMNDKAILSNSQSGSNLTIDNYGTIDGFITFGAEDSTFSNFSSNSWNIRNFADTDGDQIRDTKAVAISDFGLGNDTFKNEATGTIRLAVVTGETTVDASNEYITAGALSISNAGTVQGQLLNLNTFENRGTIDLTENKQAGDILLISGGATAGIYGGGQFVSDGGSLKLDTVLNDGGVNSLSDILVIDDSTTASGGATKLYINQVGGVGALTKGEGIKVIETLGTSTSDSFALSKPLSTGIYEYTLKQGSADQNWYLRSDSYNPSIGAYLANQSAASSLFMHTLYDRQGHANNVAGGSAEKPSVWVRAATSKSRNQSVNGMMGTKTDASLIHLGGDVAKWQNENGNLHLGLMGSYGQTDSDVTSQVTHTTAKGKVTGFALGVYGTWFADEAQGKGLYVDGWAQYGWYKNKVSGAAQVNDEEKYDSTNWTTSVEAGYGIHLHREDNTDLMLTPQVQVTYNHYSADDHKDGNNLKVSGSDASGVITRLGARMYGKAVEGYGARPYMEANWVHNTAKNELDFNGEVLKDQIPKDKGELKLGLQGTVSKNLKVWGQVGGQWGGENYERYEGQVGVNYQW